MKNLLACLLISSTLCIAQQNPSTPLDFDLLHSELHLKPIWSNQTLDGVAILTVKPYCYPQNEMELDARGFEVKDVKCDKLAIIYLYKNNVIHIKFEKTILPEDTLQISIKYIAKPNSLTSKGSNAITSDKGLYFINPNNEIKNLPREIWTQGETQSNSAWFPTFDTPNQNHTIDMYLEVEKNQTTLSNGLLVDTKNIDLNHKIDHWKQSLEHAVYLTMFTVGDFKKVIDPNFKDFEVSYYLEPAYAQYAQDIFGRTPEMIRFYENILGVKYPWAKYAQIPVRQYVSGAMENTTATVHSKSLLKTKRQLLDGNDDGVIAHELFHHWFGDYVTCESWSNLPLNESFANFSEYLWATHKKGKDEGDYVNMTALAEYLEEAKQKQVPMIRYNYVDREDMFDAHSYQKGGRILNLLKGEVGEKAFFKSLNYYLTKNAFQTTEIDNLRLAFEKITGRDLKWFFDQWFLMPGHPRLNVSKKIEKDKLKLTIIQTKDSVNLMTYKLKLPIEIQSNTKKITQTLEIEKDTTEVEILIDGNFEGVLVNPDGYFLGEIKQEKTKQELINQYKNSSSIFGRIEAIEKLMVVDEKEKTLGYTPLKDTKVREMMLEATQDKFWRIREMAVQKFFDYDGEDFLKVEKTLQRIVKNDPESNVRAEAILALKNFLNPQNETLFRAALKDSSYLVNSAALEALFVNNVTDADSLANANKNIEDNSLFAAVGNYYASKPKPEYYDWFIQRMQNFEGVEIYQNLGVFGSYLAVVEPVIQKKSVGYLKNLSLNSADWYNRVAAAQSLMTMGDLPEAKAALKEIYAHETDERLMNYYKQVK